MENLFQTPRVITPLNKRYDLTADEQRELGFIDQRQVDVILIPKENMGIFVASNDEENVMGRMHWNCSNNTHGHCSMFNEILTWPRHYIRELRKNDCEDALPIYPSHWFHCLETSVREEENILHFGPYAKADRLTMPLRMMLMNLHQDLTYLAGLLGGSFPDQWWSCSSQMQYGQVTDVQDLTF